MTYHTVQVMVDGVVVREALDVSDELARDLYRICAAESESAGPVHPAWDAFWRCWNAAGADLDTAIRIARDYL